jgi:hypothetical protein
MMSLEDFKLLYVLSCLSLGLIILSPTLAIVIRLPGGERFSELWILGSEGMAEGYPFNVRSREIYNVTLGIGNHMGCLEYYLIYVKLRNQSEPLPDSLNGTPSSLEPIFEFRAFLHDGQTWSCPIVFSFEGNGSSISKFIVNSCELNIDKVAVWDEENKGFYYELFFELWVYNTTSMRSQFHNRFVWIWLNVSVSI